MRYPSISNSKCNELATQLAGGQTPAIDANADWIGNGGDVDLKSVAQLAEEITHSCGEWTDPDRDRFEGQFCGRLHETLSAFPVDCLDDRGFWRYLALRHFWAFIAWREQGPFSKGNHLKYVDATSSTESVLPRMFLRANALGGSVHAPLAGAIPHSTDFWRSHILRVRTGSTPALARAFASRQAESRLSTEPLRDTARRINRTSTNIVLSLYTDKEAQELLSGFWPSAKSD